MERDRQSKVLVQQGAKGELLSELMDAIKREKILFQRVPVQKLNHMVKKNHQGVIAMISPLPYYEIDQVYALSKPEEYLPSRDDLKVVAMTPQDWATVAQRADVVVNY